MKAYFLFTGTGPIVVLTSSASIRDQALQARLADKGVERFVAWELPLELVRERYGGHFQAVMQDPQQIDDLRVVDYDGRRGIKLFHLSDLHELYIHEPDD